jgi:hypothetical protein
MLGIMLISLMHISCDSSEGSPTDTGGGGGGTTAGDMIIDHTCCDISAVPRSAIQDAIDDLHIAYGHTSHGSQLITGMDGLAVFLGDDLYNYSNGGAGGTLDLHDRPFGIYGASDLGNPDGSAWEAATRAYLADHPDVNVIIWSWCGQLGNNNETYVLNYLGLMSQLELDYPDVQFVYMTGHLDGSREVGTLHQNNERIREFCRNNDRILYDFADIESYDPDGNYYLPLRANDNCDYDTNDDRVLDANWAIDWQNANPGEWFDCPSAHSQPLNANLKAYAAWHLWARLAGWDGS